MTPLSATRREESMRPTTAAAPVIWISGFSASGKTTVGRRVEATLRERGTNAVFLDGDDLRSILASRWGYTRDERVDLARVYFRLCSHLASQGVTVVISAVAMYDDARVWLKQNVPAAVEVYLDVPEEERRERDKNTKGIYDELAKAGNLYDEPTAPDLVVSNYGRVTAQAAAAEIVAFIDGHDLPADADHGRSEHWARFYVEAVVPESPSSFATFVAAQLPPGARVLEVGCGNGRDSSFFARRGFDVTALDVSEAAIEACRRRHRLLNTTYFHGEIALLPADVTMDVVYSRFCLHAMTPAEEHSFVTEAASRLPAGGELHIECRSINDPLARKGEVLSKNERIFGHYRRFIIPEDLTAELEAEGFDIKYIDENRGVARLGDDDPAVLRICATRT